VLQIQADSLKLEGSDGLNNQTAVIITEKSRTVYDAPIMPCRPQESPLALMFLRDFTFSCPFLEDSIQAAIADRTKKTASPEGTAFGTCVIKVGAETFQPVVRL
jgi:hypothetical protein